VLSDADEPQWDRLAAAHELERRGARALVISPSGAVRAEVRRRLEQQAPALRRIEPSHDVLEQVHGFAQQAARASDGSLPVVWIEAEQAVDDAAWLDALVVLNVKRDLIDAQGPVFVVLAGPRSLQQMLGQRAPDLMSTVSPVLVLGEAQVEAPSMVEPITWLHRRWCW
jgi:hypothetical protein